MLCNVLLRFPPCFCCFEKLCFSLLSSVLGKSTQVPQIIIRDTTSAMGGDNEEVINIIVTEPRRVAAVSVSQRVGEEMGDASPSSSSSALQGALCGYTVRLDARVGPRCCVEFVTVGVLLRRIQSSKGSCLKDYSHVIVDEVHERSVDSDLLLMMLKEYREQSKAAAAEAAQAGVKEEDPVTTPPAVLAMAQKRRKRCFPRVVMMSATADVEAIASYWGVQGGGEKVEELAVVHIPGRFVNNEPC